MAQNGSSCFGSGITVCFGGSSGCGNSNNGGGDEGGGGGGGNGGGGGGGNKKPEELQPYPVKEQLPRVQYCINSPPRRPLVMGFQHYILSLGMTRVDTEHNRSSNGRVVEKARVIRTLLLITGLSTFFQTLFGTRLPSVVVGSYTYMIPTTSIVLASGHSSLLDNQERFVQTMRAIQGALIITWLLPNGNGILGFVEKYSEIIFLRYLPHYVQSKRPICDRFAVLFSTTITWLFAQLRPQARVYNKKSEITQMTCRTDRAGLIKCIPLANEAFAMMVASFVSLFESTSTFYATTRYGSATSYHIRLSIVALGWAGRHSSPISDVH
ncbi:unnamed protein product [Dovyalis caffra]|uniref:Vomeronasal type-1 receptor n=1 Tax=Dovyalis caffra TaxID=77055 RepID=A0AAV1RL35_9ROSI|nr:unnamed protein product [Dovyalis caffra]